MSVGRKVVDRWLKSDGNIETLIKLIDDRMVEDQEHLHRIYKNALIKCERSAEMFIKSVEKERG